MPETTVNKIDDLPQTLWGSPQNWRCSAGNLQSSTNTPRTPSMLGHDRVEEIRFHPSSTKHLVPGSPTSLETDLPVGSGYRTMRYSFEADRSHLSPIACGAEMIWYKAYHLGHFNYTRSRMRPRHDAPLAPVIKSKLWTPRKFTAELEDLERPATVRSA